MMTIEEAVVEWKVTTDHWIFKEIQSQAENDKEFRNFLRNFRNDTIQGCIFTVEQSTFMGALTDLESMKEKLE